MTRVEELQQRAEIALARLGVAEEFGWFGAIFAGLAAHLKWQLGWLTLPLIVAIYFALTYSLRKQEKAATDAYERESKTGKYFAPDEPKDAA